jgi:hypothetical protein
MINDMMFDGLKALAFHLLIVSAEMISELMITDGNRAIKKGRAIPDPASETHYVRLLIQIVIMRISSQLIVNLLSTNCRNECLC